jgi:hypothetical protein
MSFNFSRLIDDIEKEIGHEYLSGAINWTDKTKNDAWSKSLNTLDETLSIAIASGDHSEVP